MTTLSTFLSHMPVAEIQLGCKNGAITSGMIATVGIVEILARRLIPEIMEPKKHSLRAGLSLSLGIACVDALQTLEEQMGGMDRMAIGAGMVAGIYINHRPFSASNSVFAAYAYSAIVGALMTTACTCISSSC